MTRCQNMPCDDRSTLRIGIPHRSFRSGHHVFRPRAFTLVEALMVLALIGILASIAAPRYANSIAGHRVSSAARRVAADLTFAASQARTSGATITVDFNIAGNRYALTNVPDPDHPGRAYTVYLAKDPYGAAISSADFSGVAKVDFDTYGQPSAGGSVVVTVGKRTKTVTLDATTGRAAVSP